MVIRPIVRERQNYSLNFFCRAALRGDYAAIQIMLDYESEKSWRPLADEIARTRHRFGKNSPKTRNLGRREIGLLIEREATWSLVCHAQNARNMVRYCSVLSIPLEQRDICGAMVRRWQELGG